VAVAGLSGADTAEPGFGLYVHWPFCRSKCPYCDFNSHVRETVDTARWGAALRAELAHYGRLTAGRRLTSVFFGGGTPSLMPSSVVGGLLDELSRYWSLHPDLEVTLEANPTSAEAAAFAGFRAAGVNRLSIGVQALDDVALRFLGRQHSAAEALRALGLARRVFPRISFDLIYGRPGQALPDWRTELARALAEGPDHLSLYQLTIEEGAAFHGAVRRGDWQPLDEETQVALFEDTRERLEADGLPAYEVSNHARPGAECRHNLVYWRYGDYVGIGPGAHGRLTGVDGRRRATRQHRAPEVWLQRVEAESHATTREDALSAEEVRDELLMMGLRLRDGLTRGDFERVCRHQPEALLSAEPLDRLQRGGYLVLDSAGLRATPLGLQRLDAVLAHLLG